MGNGCHSVLKSYRWMFGICISPFDDNGVFGTTLQIDPDDISVVFGLPRPRVIAFDSV